MEAKSFLGTARLLLEDTPDEAACRSAISRAYYACYLSTRDKAYQGCNEGTRRKEGFTRKYIRHESLANYLKHGSSRDIQRLGEELVSLHGKRTAADYYTWETISVDDANDAIEDASVFLESLSKIGSADIGQAIENYVRTVYKQSP